MGQRNSNHQLKTVVNIPLFCWGFNHPFGDAGFLPSTVCRVYNMYNSEKWDVALIDINLYTIVSIDMGMGQS
jgi:hypothetical protein